MFNLEQSITEWRQRMLAAGVKAPVPLEELEIHLREEIEQHVKLGLKESEVFESAVQNVGQPGALKSEFVRAGGFSGWLGHEPAARKYQILGALWLAQSLWFLHLLLPIFLQTMSNPQAWDALEILMNLFIIMEFIGVYGSICLLRGVELGRRIIRINALLCVCFFGVEALLAWAIQFPMPVHFYTWGGGQLLFNLITLWLLRAPIKLKPSYV